MEDEMIHPGLPGRNTEGPGWLGAWCSSWYAFGSARWFRVPSLCTVGLYCFASLPGGSCLGCKRPRKAICGVTRREPPRVDLPAVPPSIQRADSEGA